MALLFDRPSRIGALRSGIDALCDDPHPPVRIAATGLPLPILKFDGDLAIKVMLEACAHPDDRVLLSYDLTRFLGHTILHYHEKLQPLLARMASSTIGEVAQDGAGWVALAWSYRGVLAGRVDLLTDGDRWQRSGIADALAIVVAQGRDNDFLLDRLLRFLNDPDQEVRGTAARVFHEPSLLIRPTAPALVESFLLSLAIDENVDHLLRGLEGLEGPLRPYAQIICRIAERFAGPLAAEARDHRTSRPLAAGLLAKLLIRLYEQAEYDPEVRRSCLDAWDQLLRQGLGYEVLQDTDGPSI